MLHWIWLAERTRASWRHEHDLEWSPSDGEGRECVTVSDLDRLRIRLIVLQLFYRLRVKYVVLFMIYTFFILLTYQLANQSILWIFAAVNALNTTSMSYSCLLFYEWPFSFMFTLNNIDNNRRRQWWKTLTQSKRLVFVLVTFPRFSSRLSVSQTTVRFV